MINRQVFLGNIIKICVGLAVCIACTSSWANGGGSVAKLWVADESLLNILEPDLSTTDEEVNSIRSSQAAMTESDKQNMHYWAAGAPNYRWMQVLLKRYAKGPPSPIKARGISLLNLAIYDAVASAENAKAVYKRPRPTGIDSFIDTPATSSYPSSHAAAAGAAAEVLRYLLPDETAAFQSMAESAAAGRVNAGVSHPTDVDMGLLMGKQIGEQIIATAKADNSDAKWSGERPTGPGNLKGELFVYPAAGQWKGVVIKSPDEYLPSAPPEHDSEQMKAELKMLHEIERSVPVGIRAWSNHSTYRAFQWWYEQIALSVFEHKLSDDVLKTSLVYATIAVANSDSLIACFNAKYTWWQIRPGQLDESLETLFPNPPHPSYPSAHSCAGSAFATTVGYYFPDRKDEFDAAAHEGGVSRQLAGIHYASDHSAGQHVGRGVAAVVISHTENLLK